MTFIDLGDSKIDNSEFLEGKYSTNRLFMFSVNLAYQF